MDEIGKHHLESAVELVKNGHSFVLVIDNIDWMETVHDTRKDNQNRSIHAVAGCLVFDRVPNSHLPTNAPQKKLASIRNDQIIAQNNEEILETKKRYAYIIARIIVEFIPAFQFFKEFIPSQLPHTYLKETKAKSTIVNLPIQLKDEKKYADCVEIMDELESLIEEIMTQAKKDVEEQTIVEPQECNASRPFTTVPCYGDQLTRVRFAGAKALRAGSHTAKDRLEHLYPFRIVHWHTKKSFMKVSYM